MEDLRLTDDLVVPAAELRWTFTTSGGPGGQHANRSATRAEVRFDIGESEALPGDVKARLLTRLGSRAPNGVVMVAADDSRSQWRNRRIAHARLRDLLQEALRPETPRRPTRPSRAAMRKRLDRKRRRSETKRLRRKPELD
jgi:ribosome-associated protein